MEEELIFSGTFYRLVCWNKESSSEKLRHESHSTAFSETADSRETKHFVPKTSFIFRFRTNKEKCMTRKVVSFDERVRRAGGFQQLFDSILQKEQKLDIVVQKAFSAESGLINTFGFRIIKVLDGYSELEFRYNSEVSGRRGRKHVHGGVILAALDTISGLAIMTKNNLIDQSTLEIKVNFLEPLYRDPFKAVGRVVRIGRRFAVAEGDILDNRGVLCAKSLGTWALFDGDERGSGNTPNLPKHSKKSTLG